MTDLDVTALAAQLLATSSDGVVIADPSGTIVYWNQGAADMFGYSPSRALGATLNLIVPERFRSRHWEGFANTMRTGETKYADRVLAVPGMRRDGHQLSIEFRVTLLGDERAHPTAIGAVIRDVTQRWEHDRKIRARLAELESVQTGTDARAELGHPPFSRTEVSDTSNIGRDGSIRSQIAPVPRTGPTPRSSRDWKSLLAGKQHP